MSKKYLLQNAGSAKTSVHETFEDAAVAAGDEFAVYEVEPVLMGCFYRKKEIEEPTSVTSKKRKKSRRLGPKAAKAIRQGVAATRRTSRKSKNRKLYY